MQSRNTVVIVVFSRANMLVLLSYAGYDRWSAMSQVNVCVVDETEREIIREIVLKGIQGALEDQVKHLFEIWMKDHSEQPKRAIVGTNNAVHAFVRARANTLKWDPPMCGDGHKLQSGSSRPYVMPPRKQ